MIATRLNVFDGIPYRKGRRTESASPALSRRRSDSAWGTRRTTRLEPDLAEPLALVGLLQELGVCLVNVSMGNPYASPHLLRPFEYPPPDGYETPEHPLFGVDRHFRLTAAIQTAYPELADCRIGL